MKPNALMAVGASIALLSIIASAIHSAPALVTLGVGGGMLFGKGYGIWEERSRFAEPTE